MCAQRSVYSPVPLWQIFAHQGSCNPFGSALSLAAPVRTTWRDPTCPGGARSVTVPGATLRTKCSRDFISTEYVIGKESQVWRERESQFIDLSDDSY